MHWPQRSVLVRSGWAQAFASFKQFERGVVFRFGRVQTGIRGPGLTLLIPIADRLEKADMQIITMPVPAQDGIARGNVTVRVDAVIDFSVADPARVVVGVQEAGPATDPRRRQRSTAAAPLVRGVARPRSSAS